MADQKRWFKLWCSAPSDDALLELSPELRWAWAVLGCYTKEHGTKGRVVISESNMVLKAQMGVGLSALKEIISVLPNIHIEEGKNRNGKFTVTWHNWNKYQALRSKRRGEEKRGEENKKRVKPSPTPSYEYDDSWSSEPWPSVKAFVALYNQLGPETWPAVQKMTQDREAKIREYLGKFPERSFWEQVFSNAKASTFLRGYQNGTMDWFLQRGKSDQVENCLKTYEGKYNAT
jgi:hypothetical protein